MAEAEPFAYFALEGGQFEAAGMPASAAIEVARYREVVYELAREAWLADNGRARVPAGFERAFDLRLTSIEPGSARPVLQLQRTSGIADSDLDEWFPYFIHARDDLTLLYTSVNALDSAPAARMSKPLLGRIRALGGSLGADDQLVVGEPGGESGAPVRATVTQQTRAVLRSIDATLDADPGSTVNAVGVITEYDSTQKTFRLRRDSDAMTIVCRLLVHREALAATVKSGLSEDGIIAPDVIVIGQAHTDEVGDFGQIFDVESVSVERTINQKAMMQRLAEIRDLTPGWWGPSSVVPGEGILAEVERLTVDLREIDVPVSIAPTRAGSVVFEWRRSMAEYTVELEPDQNMLMIIDHVDTDEIEEEHRPFDHAVLVRFFRTGRWNA